MLKNEAKWIGNVLSSISDEVNPLLNIGSSTLEFRTKDQPFIQNDIFTPLEKKGVQIVHTDIKAENGVDLVGDLTDEIFLEKLSSMNFKSVLCSNLLEHLEDPTKISHLLVKILQPGSFLIITGPHHYPYHKDPIDTLFRPNVMELASFFPGTEIVKSEIVKEDYGLLQEKYRLKRTVKINAFPFNLNEDELKYKKDINLMFKRYSSVCVLLRKMKSK
jgi:2-polyprenyl-3-methyl-5-hydroxy-6-metoxy-1,4-benzoquinol methylase